MFPEVSRAATFVLTMGSVAAGLALVGVAFKAADFAVDAVAFVGRRLRLSLAPRCVDCGGKGWRRWKDGDGAPLSGWTDCRLCRGLGRIVDEGEEG
jgi:hypothetical protein